MYVSLQTNNNFCPKYFSLQSKIKIFFRGYIKMEHPVRARVRIADNSRDNTHMHVKHSRLSRKVCKYDR